MKTLYRLIFSDGSHGAWSDDLEKIKANARFFNAIIETKIIK